MLNKIKIYFLLFIIYAFIGWCMEVIVSLFKRKKLINRGFLIGPYCPIYGTGAILITVLLTNLKNMPIVLFITAIILCAILEYLTSYAMEKVFNFRWWDYSKKRFNLNGRICLETIIPFGILGITIIYISNPFFSDRLNKINYKLSNYLFYTTLLIYVVDNIISFITILGIRKTTRKVNSENSEDNTEEITRKVKEILLGKSFAQRRLINAYPKLQAIKVKVKTKIKQTKIEIEKQKDYIENKVVIAKTNINNKIKKDIKKRKYFLKNEKEK